MRLWYEYGFFQESREQFRKLERQLINDQVAADTLLSKIYFETARSFLLEKKLDSLAYWAKRSISAVPGLPDYPIESYNLLGIYHKRLGQYGFAENYYRKAIELSLGTADYSKSRVITFYRNLTLLYKADNNPQKAIAILKEVDRSIPNLESYGKAAISFLRDHCYGLRDLYRLPEEQRILVRLGASYEMAKLTKTEAYGDFLLNSGNNQRKLGALREAVASYQIALTTYSELTKAPLAKQGFVYRNLGNVYGDLNNYPASDTSYQNSLEISTLLKDTFGMADDYNNLGINRLEQGKPQQAISYFEKALINHQIAEAKVPDLGNDYINLADAHRALGQLDAAKIYADSALRIEEPYFQELSPQLAYTYLTQARILQHQGDAEEALRWAQKSLTANHESFTFQDSYTVPSVAGYSKYDYFFEALLLKGELLAGMDGDNNADQAQNHFERAGDLLDDVKDQLITREDQITLANYNARLAEAAIGHAYQQWSASQDERWANRAFQYAERSKAGVLRSAIAGTAARRSAGIPDSLLRQEEELSATIGYHKRELASGPDSTARVRHQRELFTASQARKELLATFERDYPRYAELKRAVPTLSLTELQAVLQPDEVVRSYFTGTDKLYVFNIARGSVVLHEQDKPKRLDRDVSGLVKGMTRRIDRLYLRKAYALYELLVPEPEESKWQKNILIPDGPLLKIPFEALLTEPLPIADTIDFSALPYFLKEHTISYAASASLFYEIRLSEQDRADNRSATDNGLLAFAPVFENGEVSASAQRSMKKDALLTALPATRIELTALQSLFTTNNRKVKTLIGPVATEAALRYNDLTNARYLHFATHGFVNEQFPDLSGLALYPGTTGGTDDDFLSVGEVYNLKLKAKLVTLSACETGLGKVANGEGVLGFTHAFLYAGAQNLLVSLWQVQDKATSNLMVDFYRRTLTEGDKGLSGNLRAAKLQMIKAGGFSHPYYWSPFVLIGD
ncbi:MAG: CHAT domain-containing protein [Lewinella sp.]